MRWTNPPTFVPSRPPRRSTSAHGPWMDLWSLQQKLHPPGGCSAAGSTRHDHPIRLPPASPLARPLATLTTATKSSEAPPPPPPPPPPPRPRPRPRPRLGLAQAHTRAPASLREAALELETVELVTAAKTASTDISYAMLIQRVIWVKPDGQRAQDTVTLYKFPWPLWRFSEYETDVIRFPDPTTRPFSLPPLTFSPGRAHAKKGFNITK